jgi:hypothetical protein
MASFSSYVQDKLYNELFSCAKRFLQENGSKFDFGSSLHRAGYSRLEDISVRHTKVEDLPGCRIKFDVYLELEVVTQEGNHHYDDYEDENIWLLVTCEGDIGDELENVSIIGVEDYTTKPKPNNPMDDALVPVFGKKELDKRAEDFLRRNYPKALLEPISVEPDKLCEKMGLTIKRARISEDGNVFGRVYFYDGTVDVFDDDTGEVHTEDVKAGTILVDTTASFLYGIGAFNNTIVHECIHWDIHKKAVAFARMYNKGITSIGCKIVGGSIEKKFDFIEWQANNLAPRVQLPTTMVKKYVDNRISYIRRETGLYDYVDIIEILIKDVATHFAVSQTAAKIRLIDLGYEEAKGAMIYLDGHYVRPHKSSSTRLENNQTFSISATDAAWLRLFPGSGLKEVLDEGRYIFVENHYVLNSKYYVEQGPEGELQLTHYALNHMEECCLIFTLSLNNKDVPERYHTECFLNRGFDVKVDFTPAFHGGHATKESQDEELNRLVLESADFALTLPNDYVEALKKAIEWVGNPSHAQIENKDRDGVPHGVNRKTLERCLKGERVDVKSLVAICLSLHLPYKVSTHIIEHSSSPLVLREDAHKWYDFVLETMYTKDIPEINAFLLTREGIEQKDLL